MSPTRSRTVSGAVLTAGLALALSACGSTGTPTPAASSASSSSSSSSSSPSSTTSADSSSAAAVKIATTSLGTVVVDAQGRTLYMFTKDTKGTTKSACTGQCLAAWPPALTTGTPAGDGVTGALATIDTPDGKQQITLNGWPLYLYAKDAKAGDVTGQNVGKVWFVVDQTGTPVQAEATATTSGY